MIIYSNQTSKKTRRQKQRIAEIRLSQKRIKASIQLMPRTPPIAIRRPGSEDFKAIKSVESNEHVAFRPADKVYTGTAMVGIAVMHKSNAIPVFSKEQAEDVSKMRRG